MARGGFVNELLNPYFGDNAYGTAAVTSGGKYTSTRHKLERTGAAGVVTATPGGTTPTTSTIEKWLRGRSCLDIAVAGGYNPASDTANIRQRLRTFDQKGAQAYLYRGWYFADLGATFDVGLGGEMRTVPAGLGSTTLQYWEMVFRLGDLATEYLLVDEFSKPTPGASYKLAFVQLEILKTTGDRGSDPELRRPVIERDLCSEFAIPLRRGKGDIVSGTSQQIHMGFESKAGMRTTPSLIGIATSVDFIQKTTGSVFTSASPSFTLTSASPFGARVSIGGFTSPSLLGSGVDGVLGTDLVAVLDADY